MNYSDQSHRLKLTMVISYKHRYIYIESPMTGSTAVADELEANYDGVRILRKHALPFELSKTDICINNFFIFTNIRNPLDRLVSVYLKTLNNHNEKYTQNPYQGLIGELYFSRMARRHRRTVKESSFFKFIKGITIYDEQSRIYLNQCSRTIRFECLAEDFADVIKQLGITLLRPLPVRNPTAGKQSFMSYYNTPYIQREAVRKLGPYMNESAYTFPADWEAPTPALRSKIIFHIFGVIRIISWRILRPQIANRGGL